jgi:hypothetical protein
VSAASAVTAKNETRIAAIAGASRRGTFLDTSLSLLDGLGWLCDSLATALEERGTAAPPVRRTSRWTLEQSVCHTDACRSAPKRARVGGCAGLRRTHRREGACRCARRCISTAQHRRPPRTRSRSGPRRGRPGAR